MYKLSVIIPVKNEEDTVEKVINEVKLLNPYEILVILNGSTDNTKRIVQKLGCTVIEYSESLGHDIGRSIGSLMAKGDILLFVDGDIIIPHVELTPFVESIKKGNDIALNNLEVILHSNIRPHSVTVLKKTINDMLNKTDLQLNSLVAVPHAISKAAVKKIGWKNLSIPPLAQAIAIKKGLSVVCPAYVDVISSNKIRPEIHFVETGEPYSPIENVIIGDHLSAINYLIHEADFRGGFIDDRDRDFIYNISLNKRKKTCTKSAIICDDSVGNTANVLKVIHNLQDAGAEEIIVVSRDDSLNKKNTLINEGVIFVHLIKEIGSFVNRIVGASLAVGDIVLFTDSNSRCSANHFAKYFEAIEAGADVAMINRSERLSEREHINQITTIEYFLNIVLKNSKLANNSLNHFPHAFNKKVIEKINPHSLMIPPLAQVKIFESNFVVKTIDLDIKDDKTSKQNFEVLIGDHIEAISYYLSITNERGNFTIGTRNFNVLKEFKDD